MIKFKNLKAACKELDFKLVSKMRYLVVLNREGDNTMFFFPDRPWDLNFTDYFNFIELYEKAKIIKAITKDYEDYINGD